MEAPSIVETNNDIKKIAVPDMFEKGSLLAKRKIIKLASRASKVLPQAILKLSSGIDET